MHKSRLSGSNYMHWIARRLLIGAPPYIKMNFSREKCDLALENIYVLQ